MVKDEVPHTEMHYTIAYKVYIIHTFLLKMYFLESIFFKGVFMSCYFSELPVVFSTSSSSLRLTVA